MSIPQLKGDASKAVRYRGGPLQIIASAGSGKTEVVSQRVADLFADGVDPEGVVAFTFTEKAAAELKLRIEQRVEARLGRDFVDRLNRCYVGTIHAYCYGLLRDHVARYETYDVLDEHRLVAFLTRQSSALGLKDLAGSLFRSISEFVRNIGVVDNELIKATDLDGPFRDIVEGLDDRLSDFRFLTYGQLIAFAVAELDRPEVAAAVHGKLRHLIVDEYQDINPAQEALIERLTQPPVELCVVGDDDQSIYQWRGSDVSNIVTFADRYPNTATFELLTNRRSRPAIVEEANGFASTIEGRLDKSMEPYRPAATPAVVTWKAPTEAEEAEMIAQSIRALRTDGYRFRDIAVLVRSATSYGRLLAAFAAHDIPVQPGGRTGLFTDPDAQTFGRTCAYLAGHDWRPDPYARGSAVTLEHLVQEYSRRFELDAGRRDGLRERLVNWKAEADAPTKPADLVDSFYDLLADCGVADWDFDDPTVVARLGSLARCSALLADYESVRRRPRPDEQVQGEVIGGQDRGEWYYRWLAIHIQNWALGAFEGFEGEEAFTLDAVDLTTVHQAKGLEWPVVFVPCVSANRFPSSRTGEAQSWHVPEHLFDRTRYEGTENDERRLFYVAMTRARDWLSVSTHDRPNKRSVAPSPFLRELARGEPEHLAALPLPGPPDRQEEDEDLLSTTFSELADFKACGLAYRLRNLIGFQPRLAPELGYGRAVHHILRNVAEHTRRYRGPPSPDQLDAIFDEGFFLPAANKPGHRQMKSAARRLVDRYVQEYGDELRRVWAVERPFELHLSNATVKGRADVILDEHDGVISSLAVVDYKTSADEHQAHDRQLQLYADAGRREGLDVRAAYVHDLNAGERIEVDVSATKLGEAEAEVLSLVDGIRRREFEPRPGQGCRGCDVRPMCRFAEE